MRSQRIKKQKIESQPHQGHAHSSAGLLWRQGIVFLGDVELQLFFKLSHLLRVGPPRPEALVTNERQCHRCKIANEGQD